MIKWCPFFLAKWHNYHLMQFPQQKYMSYLIIWIQEQLQKVVLCSRFIRYESCLINYWMKDFISVSVHNCKMCTCRQEVTCFLLVWKKAESKNMQYELNLTFTQNCFLWKVICLWLTFSYIIDDSWALFMNPDPGSVCAIFQSPISV